MTQVSEVCSRYHTHIAARLNAEYSAHLSATFRGLLLVPTCLDPNEPAANKDPCRLPPNLDGMCNYPSRFQNEGKFHSHLRFGPTFDIMQIPVIMSPLRECIEGLPG